jgi:hypothetical protein
VVKAILRRLPAAALLAPGLTGLLLLGLLFGIEPVGGDPDRLYRPLKQELARFLAEGRLPFWSDRLGLGVPLVAESHVAALYPINWLLYTALGVPAAYRLAMWLHYILLASTTYAYARYLRLSPHGAALAAIGFTFCGFQAIHSSHEPFYHALPYLPLAILLAEWYLASGRLLGLILLASTWGVQLTLGHFQLQLWTGCLVLVLGVWRVVADGRPWKRLLALGLALGWGAAMAAVQLRLTWEMARFLGFMHRSFADLAFFGLPPAHWAELAIPGFLRGIKGGPEGLYWFSQGSTGYEACFYIGTLPLILAFVALGGGRDRRLWPWLVITLGTVALAMLPRAWPAAYEQLTRVPGVGWFRAAGRYVVLASLGLCLAAGSGLDRSGPRGSESIRVGVTLAWAFAIAAAVWSFSWASGPGFRAVLGGPRLAVVVAAAALSWCVATALLWAWRRGHAGAWVLVVATAAELGALYYTSTTDWGLAVRLPGQSRILARLAQEPQVGRVAGLVDNLPIRAGAAPIFPYTGFAPLPPHPILELAKNRLAAFTPAGLAWLRRYGVTHGIWDGPVDEREVETLLELEDPALDRVVYKPPGAPTRPRWKLVRYPNPFPHVRCATKVKVAQEERSLIAGISFDPDQEAAWYNASDPLALASSPRASLARIASWDGTRAVAEHDETCDLIVNRTFYPGWFATVDDGPLEQVARAEAGIQAVRLHGRGTSRVRFVYRPTGLAAAVALALAAWAAAGMGLAALLIRANRSRRAAKNEECRPVEP